jgi:hypothetical protein
MTARTPLFALPHLAPGQPLYETREVLEELAEDLEAILQTKAVSPAGAADLLAVATRVGNLEADQAAEDALWTPKPVTFAAGFAQYPGAFEAARCLKYGPTVVKFSGMVSVTAATTAGQTKDVCTMPLGYRPAAQVLRTCFWQSAATAEPLLLRCHVTTAGVLQVITHVALSTAAWLAFDLEFRTENT